MLSDPHRQTVPAGVRGAGEGAVRQEGCGIDRAHDAVPAGIEAHSVTHGLQRFDGLLRNAVLTDDAVRDVVAEAGETKGFSPPDGAKGVYAKRISPVWKTVVPNSWEVGGVFKSRYSETGFDEKAVDEAFARDLLQEAKIAKFVQVGAENDKADKSEVRVNLNYSAPVKSCGYAFARRHFKSDRARTVFAALGVDWWGKVYVNGELAIDVTSGWKPRPFPLKLKAGALFALKHKALKIGADDCAPRA